MKSLSVAGLFLYLFLAGPVAASAADLPPADFKAPPAGMVIEWRNADSGEALPITVLGRDGYWLRWQRAEGETRSGYTLFCWACDESFSFPEDNIDALFPLQTGKKATLSRSKGSKVWADDIEVLEARTIEVAAGTFDVFVIETRSRSVNGRWRGERRSYYAPALGWNVKIVSSDNEGRSSTWEVASIDGLTGIGASTKLDDQAAMGAQRLKAFANQPPPAATANPVEIGEVTGVKTYAFGTPPGDARSGRFVADRLVSNELLETIPGSALHATFKDGTEFRMGSASQARLDSFLYTPGQEGQLSMALGQGVFRYISGQIKQGAQIGTPDAIIGIRGTDFQVEVLEGQTRVTVYEGEVEIRPRSGGAGVSAPAGTVATVGPTGITTASAPAAAPADPGVEAGGCGG